ncbi:ATP-binding protein [Wukongibacter baidiensis]|uniref:ATP-binding protein n=1 Tax=Wukongibacter baidiensis TaxID=1723361 RepID=UPI003D7FB14D
MISSFFHNMAVLVAVLFINLEINKYFRQRIQRKSIVVLIDSTLSGILSLLVILEKYRYNGMIIDIRSVPIFFTSYSYGLKAGMIAGILPTLYRLYLGGDTAWAGIIMGVISPIAVGALFHKYDKKRQTNSVFNIKITLLAYSVHSVIRAVLSYSLLPLAFDIWLKLNISMTAFSTIAVYLMALIINIYNKTIFLVYEMKKKQRELFAERQRLKDKNKRLKVLSEQHMATLEKLYQRNDELKIANQTKNNLLANVSHELKTPLNINMTYLEYLLEDSEYPLNDNQRNMVEIAYNSSERLRLLIDDLLDISLLESAKCKLNPEKINMEYFTRSLIKDRELSIQNKNINIKLDIPQEDIYVITDVLRFRQVIDNILDNAIKFSNGEDIEITLKEDEKYIDIYIKDYGIGIDPKKLDKIFNVFYQADDSSVKKYKGVGLGLYIAKKVIETIGGEISVKNNIDKGCCFKISIPLDYTSKHNLKQNQG